MAKEWDAPLARGFDISWHGKRHVSTVSAAIAFMMECCGTVMSLQFDKAMDALIFAASTGYKKDILAATEEFHLFLVGHDMIHALEI
ncbi:hypothetical protein ABLE91_28220 [Aquabacter sp. CN5-332]|uniref:hypothetical protein n=1 Tax=Aquabacter sp. CN5-332 TaxID=3156608 RepID=UPI0032B4261F